MGDIRYDTNPSAINYGGNTRQRYDPCEYSQSLGQSVSPMSYMLYPGAYENCNKCVYDKFYTPFDVVDIESELSNRTRPLSRCDKYQYTPNCTKSSDCMSTFDKSAPIIPVAELCPIVFNNIKRPMTSGLPAMKR